MFRTVFRSDQFSLVRLGALGVAAVLVLGGCTGSGDDADAEAAEGSNRAAPSASARASAEADETSETASASPTPIPTPAVAAYKPATAEGPAENVPLPVMPELAKQESKEGLEAFGEYWYTVVNYAFETGNLEPFEAISGPECIVCKSIYDIVEPGYRNDDWIVGGKVEALSSHSKYVLTGKDLYQVLVQIRQDPYQYRGPRGLLYGENDGLEPTTVHLVEASYDGSSWFANNVVAIK